MRAQPLIQQIGGAANGGITLHGAKSRTQIQPAPLQENQTLPQPFLWKNIPRIQRAIRLHVQGPILTKYDINMMHRVDTVPG